MRVTLSLVFLCMVVSNIRGIPLSPDSSLWHKISKRDTAAALPSVDEKKNNSSQSSTNDGKAEDKIGAVNGDELIETQPDSLLSQPSPLADQSYNSENDAGSDRSIDWQLLSGNPADLERELESRRRRRSVRSLSLSRQHRIRTTGHGQRSRSKRNAYYDVNPSDLLAAYAYLQARRQDQEAEEPEPQLSLLDDVNDSDLSNLASLIYELQNADDGQGDDDDQEVLPGSYVDYEPTGYEPEIRISPEQLAALEQVLSEQQAGDEDEDDGYYPKDKRALAEPLLVDEETANDQDDEEEDGDELEPAYLIPASALEPSTEYVQVPLSNAYDNPYNFYQIDEEPGVYDEAVRRFDEEQLRQRIASLIDDINEQRQIARRRRR